MNPRIVFLIVAAFLAGLAIGYKSGKTESRVEAVQSAITAAAAVAASSNPAAAISGAAPTNSGTLAPPGQALSPSESQAVAGLLALRSGDYAASIPFLDAAADGISAPELTAFRATAREGAGLRREAEGLLKTDSEIEAVRAIARDAFMQHQDFMIAGPAYQLYLRLRPNAAQAPMMKQAIEMWGRKQRGEATD